MDIVQKLVYLKKSTAFSPQLALNIKHFYNNRFKSTVTRCTEDESLVLIIDTTLTKLSYLSMLRKTSKQRKNDIYPSYNIIKKEKFNVIQITL